MTEKSIPVGHRPTQIKQAVFWVCLLGLVVISYRKLQIDWDLWRNGLENIPNIVTKMLTINPQVIPEVLQEMILTLAIAAISVAVSAVMALVLGFLSAENTAPNPWVQKGIICVCTIVRTVPITVWVLLAVASAGFGNTAAILGLIFPTAAYMVKTYATQIETYGTGLQETMRSLGASWPVMILRGFFPMCKTSLLALTAFRLEMSVSESTVLGMIGCGGIGYLITRYIKAYKFGELMVCLLVVLFTMYALEIGTTQIRKKMRSSKND